MTKTQFFSAFVLMKFDKATCRTTELSVGIFVMEFFLWMVTKINTARQLTRSIKNIPDADEAPLSEEI